MSKVYNKKRNMIKTASLALTGVLAVGTLASCKSNSNVYSGINSEGIYSKIGDYSVTNRELFDNLVWNGASELNTRINNAIANEYYDEIKDSVENGGDNQQKYVDALREYFIINTYGISSMSEYWKIDNPDVLTTLKQKAIDNLYIKGIKLTSADFDALVQIKSKEDEELEPINWASLSNGQKETLKQYYSDLAQKQFAAKALDKKISDYENDNNKDKSIKETDKDYNHYYDDSKVINKWKDEFYYKKTFANTILIRFNSQDEINETLKAFGVKVYKSKFYYINQYGVTKDNKLVDLTDAEYNEWYDNFDFTAVSNKANKTQLTDRAVLELYIEMYNYIYTYKEELPSRSYLSDALAESSNANKRKITAVIAQGDPNDSTKYADKISEGSSVEELVLDDLIKELEKDEYSEAIRHSAKDLANVNTSLRSYVYDTLKDGEYATTGSSNSDYYYMGYKFDIDETALKSDNEDLMLYYKADVNGDVTQKDADGNDQKADSSQIDRTRNESIINKVVEILKEDDLTDDYIKTALDDAKKNDTKITIYDENLSIQFAISYSDFYSKGGSKSPDYDDVVAKVEYDKNVTYIKTSDLFKALEASDGMTASVDILTKKILKSTDAYKETANNIDEYYTQLNNTLTNFSSDGLSSYGYSSNIGKYNFMMSYFHSASVDQIIDDVYRVNAASSQILNDYSSDSALIDLLTEYCDQAYSNSFTISATNLSVYVDFNEDNVADSNFDWSTEYKYIGSNGTEVTTTYEALAKELIQNVIELLQNGSTAYNTALTDIVSEYKSSSRFTSGYDLTKDSEGNYSPAEPETYWAKYKRAGLMLSTADYSSVTNGTDYATIPTELKFELYQIYNRDGFIINNKAQSEYLDVLPYTGEAKGLKSSTGYNLMVVTSATVNASAKFENTDDINGIYKDLYYYYNEKLSHIDNLYNDADALNTNQVKAYILEYADNGTSNTLPSSISSAITSFLSPVYTKYTSAETQRELLLSWCEKTTSSHFEFFNTLGEDSNNEYEYKDGSKEEFGVRFNNIRTINKQQADNYSKLNKFDSLGGNSSVYNDWWTDLENYIKRNK